MRPGLLTVARAAELLGVSPQTVRRQVLSGQLASVWFGHRLIRVVAKSVDQTGPSPLPSGASHVDAAWLAEAWSMHPRTVKRLAHTGVVPGLFRGQQWSFQRSALEAWLEEHRVGRAAA